ncbi:MAG TPA: DUF6340 family protein [Mucilaginibacter sp.]|jgi:tetratricopeptide (TPR) repeat protein
MKIIRSTVFILLILLSACSSLKYVSVPIDYNPKLAFKPDTTNILLISRLDFNKTKISSKRKLDVIKAGALASTKYAQKQLEALPHVRVVNLADSPDMKVSADSISALASKYHSDYVLALTYFSADISLDGVQSSTAYYNTNLEVDFTLFESNGIYSKKLTGLTTESQSSMPYMGLIASLVIHPTVGGNQQSIVTAAENATRTAIQDYLPYTITHSRPLYNDAALQPSVKEILAGRFDKAYELLKPFLDGKDSRLASKAAYNLAVIYEEQGDFDIAMDMAKLSIDKNQNGYAANLMQDLKAE